MRLWHESLLPLLPRAQLLGQHRECCALRGGSWGRKHAVVDYVFVHPREYLTVYHRRVMAEMESRGYQVNPLWMQPGYRGQVCHPYEADGELLSQLEGRRPVYPEHDSQYLQECVDNLAAKGIQCMVEERRDGI